MKHGEIPMRFPSPGEGCSRGDTQDPEVTAPPEQFLASLARLLQALLSPARSSWQSQGTLPSTRVRRVAPASASPDSGLQLYGKWRILSLCVRIYIERG